ncbi:MAG TPA: carbohydrate-binding domain-containing protein [Ureibacillus sp.]|nr:carbohydrate-binding domain-containing protein [Ureibacillus sp.]
MKQNSKLIKVATPLVMCSALLFACSDDTEKSKSTSDPALAEAESLSTIGNQDILSVINDKVSYSDEDFYTKWKNATSIKLDGNTASYDGDGGVVIDDSTITIRTSGVYEISGKLNDGQIIVDAEDEESVRLILNGVEINSSTSAPIFVKNAGKTIVSLEKGTENILNDDENYVYAKSEDDEPNAALFSKDDLTINGEGTLVVNGNYNNGIASKDDLRITGGTIQIDAVDDGLMGRDLVAIKDGEISITVGGDGIKSTNDKDDAKALIAIEGGTFDITSANDGIQAETSLLIADGDFTITAGGGSPETIETREEMMPGGMPGGMNRTMPSSDSNDNSAPSGSPGDMKTTPPTTGTDKNSNSNQPVTKGNMNATPPSSGADTNHSTTPDTQVDMNTTASSSDSETESESTKGLKAAVEIAIGGGTFTIDSLDDAVHSNNSITITGGDLNVSTGDDGVHADTAILTKGGTINVTKSYEGVESKRITIADGEIHVNTVDDGINVGGGNDSSGRDFATTENTEDNLLSIHGGYIYVNAAGDGLDSNGSITMTGGTVIVNGPTENMNGALDYDESFKMNGGLLIAAGSSGMAMATSDESSQGTILMTYPETQEAGTVLQLEDSKGNAIVTFAPEKDYQTVVISSPQLEKDGTYTLSTGGTATGTETDGLFTDNIYKNGKLEVEFTLSDTVTWLNESGITEATANEFGGMGGPGGVGGNSGDMFSDLDDETREKVQGIMEQQRTGTITQEEAQAQLAELGVELPTGGQMQQPTQPK